jgi:hypothetical protein
MGEEPSRPSRLVLSQEAPCLIDSKDPAPTATTSGTPAPPRTTLCLCLLSTNAPYLPRDHSPRRLYGMGVKDVRVVGATRL